MPFIKLTTKDDIDHTKTRLYTLGMFLIILGMIALIVPIIVSFILEFTIAALLIAAGLGYGAMAFKDFSKGEKNWDQIIVAVLSLIAGILLLVRPWIGLISLTIAIAVFFAVEGIAKIIEFFRIRKVKGAVWILLSGVIELFLVYLILSNIVAGTTILGILFGINLLFSGVALCLTAREIPESPEAIEGGIVINGRINKDNSQAPKGPTPPTPEQEKDMEKIENKTQEELYEEEYQENPYDDE